MPTKDVLMMQIVLAFGQGCGAAAVDDAACAAFNTRYYGWIDKPKKNPTAMGKSPQDVWATEGAGFLDKFREIGKQAAAAGSPIGDKTLVATADAVEGASDCPYCPIKP